MPKLLFSALLRRTRDGVEAMVSEFPDIKVSTWSTGGAIVRLRGALSQRMRWTRVETGCSGEPVSPVPLKPSQQDLAVPIEVELDAEHKRGSGM